MTKYDNSGALFKNDRKEKDTHADYQGSITVEGKEFWLNAWLKDGKTGGKWMSLSVKPKEGRAEAKPQGRATRAADFDDEVPF